ncbi:MAG: hypothetical protein IKJ27_00115 [Clostridia bacterium]|nr:hypothetical protein [Clostridia bacterium]
MADLEHLEQRFQMIKEFARKKEELPRYQGENAFSFVDEHYFQAMRHMYARYRLHTIRRELAEQEVNKYQLCYIRDKTSEETMARGYRELDEKRRGIAQWTKQLMKPESRSIKELFGILFCELLPALTDKVTAEKIKEGAGYALITGCNSLSEEEIKEVEKWYP